MDLSGYLAIVRRWWWTLIVAAWIAGLTGYLVASTIPPTYEAQAKVLVGPLNTDTDTLRASGLLVQTYAQYVTTREVLTSTIQELGLDLDPADLAESVRVTANDITRILTIRVQADDPTQAASLANTMATELEQLTSSGLSRPEGLIQIIEFAEPSATPVAPQVSLIVMLAAFAGVIVAIVVILLLEYFGDTIRTGRELGVADRRAAPGHGPGAVQRPAQPGRPARPRQPGVPIGAALPPHRHEARARAGAGDDQRDPRPRCGLGGGGRGRRHEPRRGPRSGWATDRPGRWHRPRRHRHPAARLDRARWPLGSPLPGPPPDPSRSRPWRPRGPAQLVASRSRSWTPTGCAIVIAGLTQGDAIAIVVGGPIASSPVSLALARSVDSVVLVARRDRARREDVTLTTEALRLIGSVPAGVILTERPSILGLRREARRGTGGRITPVDVRGPGTEPVVVTSTTTTRRRSAADLDPA